MSVALKTFPADSPALETIFDIIPDHTASTPLLDILSHSKPEPSGVAGWFPRPLHTIPKRSTVQSPAGARHFRFPSESIYFERSTIEFFAMGLIPSGDSRRGIVPHFEKIFKSISGIFTYG